jgi:hypothetical protein
MVGGRYPLTDKDMVYCCITMEASKQIDSRYGVHYRRTDFKYTSSMLTKQPGHKSFQAQQICKSEQSLSLFQMRQVGQMQRNI